MVLIFEWELNDDLNSRVTGYHDLSVQLFCKHSDHLHAQRADAAGVEIFRQADAIVGNGQLKAVGASRKKAYTDGATFFLKGVFDRVGDGFVQNETDGYELCGLHANAFHFVPEVDVFGKVAKRVSEMRDKVGDIGRQV